MFMNRSIENDQMVSVRADAKKAIESFEHWSRRLINEEMSTAFGNDYFSLKLSDGNNLVKSEILNTIENRMKEEPKRFPRKIDAILIEDIAYFFCKKEFYQKCFEKVFKSAFAGVDDIRLRIERVANIRNKLYHGNPISFREAEQVFCYCNDFVDAYKLFYRTTGRDKDFNVPFFIKVADNYGRCEFRKKDKIEDLAAGREMIEFRPGDVYKIWVEVDSNFPEDFYEIRWYMHDKKVGAGKCFQYTVSVEDVTDFLILYCDLTTNRKWHKHRTYDDAFSVCMGRVLPPIEDLY